jgi:hypothetical protein
MAIIIAGLLLCIGCAGWNLSNNNPRHDPNWGMYDERTGAPVAPINEQ